MAIITALPTTTSKVIPLSLNVRNIDYKEASTIQTNQQFFTTDTDAWLQIAIGDLDLTGTTSNLTLVNTTEGDTGSVINIDVSPQTLADQKYFFYEMSQIVYVDGVPDSPVLHAGDWLGQLYVTKNGENITSCRFRFSVKGHLLDNTTPGLIMIEDIAALKANVVIMNDLIAGFQGDIQTMAAAEILRVALYEEVSLKLTNGELVGPQGEQGLQGAAGADGAPGPEGPQGPIGLSGTSTRAICFYVDSTLKVETKVMTIIIPMALTITDVRLNVDVAPVGATLITDINKNGTTIYTTQANRPTIAAGAFSVTAALPDTVSLALGDKLSIDLDQVGSTTPGENLAVMLVCAEG